MNSSLNRIVSLLLVLALLVSLLHSKNYHEELRYVIGLFSGNLLNFNFTESLLKKLKKLFLEELEKDLVKNFLDFLDECLTRLNTLFLKLSSSINVYLKSQISKISKRVDGRMEGESTHDPEH